MSDSAIPWIVACPTPLSMEFPRQEYWSGLSFPSPGDLPDLGTKPLSPVSPALASRYLPMVPLGKPLTCTYQHQLYVFGGHCLTYLSPLLLEMLTNFSMPPASRKALAFSMFLVITS